MGPGFSAPMPTPVDGAPLPPGPVARVYPGAQGPGMIQTAGYRPMYYPRPYDPYPGYMPMGYPGYGYGPMNTYAR
jgi:hypothetical protein